MTNSAISSVEFSDDRSLLFGNAILAMVRRDTSHLAGLFCSYVNNNDSVDETLSSAKMEIVNPLPQERAKKLAM